SSRRRHTRFSRDWSSDVCSSDLLGKMGYLFLDINTENPRETFGGMLVSLKDEGQFEGLVKTNGDVSSKGAFRYLLYDNDKIVARSEERRVGKGCRCGWAASAEEG